MACMACSTLAIRRSRYRSYSGSASARPRESALALPEYERYLERRIASVEQAMQAMTAELERVAEGQRLSAQLLAERLPAASSAPRLAGEPRRINTPH